MGRPGPAVDLATLAARTGAALRAEGVAVGPERGELFARAVALTRPETTGELYRCARATLVCDAADLPALDRVFVRVFDGTFDPAGERGQPDSSGSGSTETGTTAPAGGARPRSGGPSGSGSPVTADRAGRDSGTPPQEVPHAGIATAAERLASRDFAELTGQELAELVHAMRRLRPALPLRRSRRTTRSPRGSTVDMRATLRDAGRTAGHPVRLRRRRAGYRPRRLVVLCDISGSMAPYARALLQLLYCAAGGVRAEVFTFATRLTRLTRALSRSTPAAALAHAGRIAPDWSGGTRIGGSLRQFTDAYGARGMARQAVLLIVSDGWDTGDPAEVGRQMARLSRLAHRIVWANPRTASPQFQPLAGGMAAAWPYCDAVVSAHNLAALGKLLDALADPEPGPGRYRRFGAAVPERKPKRGAAG